MRKILLMIAMSLDGYIADRDGGVDWLAGETPAADEADAFETFMDRVDTIFMGYTTYRQIVTELSPDTWPYPGKETLVFTHRKLPDTAHCRFTAEDPLTVAERLKTQSGKAIWLCGGASLIAPFVRADAIDEYQLTIIPTLLGAGIRLFTEGAKPIPLSLTDTKAAGGMVTLTYTRRLPPVDVAQATDEVIDGWMALVKSLTPTFPGLSTPAEYAAHRAAVLTMMERGEALCVIQDGQIAGVGLFSRKDAEVCFLAVDARYRGRRIGEAMVRAMLAALPADRDIQVITWKADDAHGAPARHLYEKMGFAEDGLVEVFGATMQRYCLRRADNKEA